MLRWIKILLSSSHEASIKRTIGLVSFVCFLIILFIALLSKTSLVNLEILKQIVDYLFAIIMVCVGGVTMVDVAQVIKGRYTKGFGGYDYGYTEDTTNTTTTQETGGE